MLEPNKQIVFLTKFFLIFAILQALILWIDLGFVENEIARIEAIALGMRSIGNVIEVNGSLYSIDANCTGLLSGAIIAAIVFSFRKPEIRTKALIFFSAAIALFFLNIPRIFVVLWAAKEYGADAAGIVHQLTWFSTAAFILALWYIGTKKIARINDFSELL